MYIYSTYKYTKNIRATCFNLREIFIFLSTVKKKISYFLKTLHYFIWRQTSLAMILRKGSSMYKRYINSVWNDKGFIVRCSKLKVTQYIVQNTWVMTEKNHKAINQPFHTNDCLLFNGNATIVFWKRGLKRIDKDHFLCGLAWLG